jgi:hypothetical protein
MDRTTAPAFRTEFEFTLPKGFVDDTGVVHKRGVMRLATAADEILPLRDPRVQSNPAYLTIIVLARVITRLGSLPQIDAQLIEALFASDLEYLRQLYDEINAIEEVDGVSQDPVIPFGNGRLAGGMPVLGEA